MSDIKVITEEILDKTAIILTESYTNHTNLTAFLAELDSINTFGYFTSKGREKLRSFIYANPALQETRIEILQIMNNAFIQQGITLYGQSAYVAEIYTPLVYDEDLKAAYINLMPEYKEDMLTTYGAIFIQAMMLRVLSVRIINLLKPKLLAKEEANMTKEISKKRSEIIDSLPDRLEVANVPE
nr:MAG TPA: hypothetical protein [Caudoviricetes sp.]